MPARLGVQGEDLAAGFLVDAGWAVLHRNFRAGRKEIDLVARRGGVVAFVEVKTRTGAGCGHPFEAITSRKRAEIEEVAEAWISRHGDPAYLYRFDAIAVVVGADRLPEIEHLEDAWGY